jgi:iron complex outermembrane receptor protein
MRQIHLVALASVSLAGLAAAAPAFAQGAPGASANGEEIVVTARRRAEELSKVPVSVAVMSQEIMETRGVRSEGDLQLTIPGLLVRSGNTNNSLNYVMRGESVDGYSGSPPGVQPYMNEVPYPIMAANTFYDFENVQAVKGPQGTLFGRNSTGGAVLFQTQAPTQEFEGHLSVQYGNYDRLIAEGAINLPLVTDKLAIRLAGTVTSGGAFVRNLYNNEMLGDKAEKSGRLSIAFTPTDTITNQTMVQISRAHGTNVPNTMYNAVPCSDPSGWGFNSCIYSPSNQPFFNDLLAGNVVNGYPNGWVFPGGFEALPDYLRKAGKRVIAANAPFWHRSRSTMVTNKSVVELSDAISLKNIFGYSKTHNAINYDTDYSPYPIIGQFAPEKLLGPDRPQIENVDTRTWSNELQLEGTLMDDRLNFILGGFYLSSKEDYLSPLWIGAINFQVNYNAKTGNKSKALFGQVTYKITDKLNVTLGGRYTWEKVTMSQGALSLFGQGNPQAVKQSDPSWTAGLDYQATDELMLYIASRGSWRRGGFNPFNPPTPTPLTAAEAGGGNYFLAEKVKDVEAGVKYNGRAGATPIRANLAFYNSWVKNIQKTAYVVIGGTVSSATVNVPKTKIWGIEADMSVSPSDWLSLGWSATYTHAKFTNADSRLFGATVRYGPFGDVPKFSGTLYADAKLELPGDTGNLNYHVDVYRQSSFYFSNLAGTIQPNTKLPAYTLLNMRLDWDKVMGSNVKLSLYGKNLTNKVYYTGGSAGAQNFSNNSASFGAPRQYGVAARIDF